MDVKVRVIRNFRLRHGISLKEIAEAAGISPQWVSQIELCDATASKHNKREMMSAIKKVILERKRRLRAMETEYSAMKRKLLEEEGQRG